MEAVGVKWVYADNDSKLHQRQVVEAWAEYGIRVHPGAGKRCWDREKGGFPVDYPELMPLDRTIHHKCQNSRKMDFMLFGTLRNEADARLVVS